EPPPLLAVGGIRVADSAALGPMIRDMLATSLGGVEGLRVVANSRLVELIPRGADTSASATTLAARRAGAREVLEGEVNRDERGLVLTLRRVGLADGEVRRGYVVHAATRYALVDSAVQAIARDLGTTAAPAGVAVIRTASPAAYALYEEGLRAYYKYDAPAALRLMTAALERDSGFAMAAYYAWQASRTVGPLGESWTALARARRLAPRAIERERLLIQASVAGEDGPYTATVAIADTLTVRYPTDPDGQILLGDARMVMGDWAGSVRAFARAVALDSAAGALGGAYCRVCLALDGMARTYLWWDSAGAAERSVRRLIALRPEDRLGWALLMEPLLRQGRRAEAEEAMRRALAWSSSDASGRHSLNRDLIRSGRLEEADSVLLGELRTPIPVVQHDARWLLLISLRNQGRLREAEALAREGIVPGTSGSRPLAPPEGIHVAVVAFEGGNPGEAARLYLGPADETARSVGTPPGRRARFVAWFLTLAGTALAAAGDTAAVRRLADSVEAAGERSYYGRDPRLHHFLRGLLLQGEGRQSEAVEAFRRAMYSPTDGYTRVNLELGRSLMALGRPREAAAVLQPALRGGVDGSNTYVTHTELHEALAQAWEQAGVRDSAVVHYRAVAAAWRAADPRFHARLARARAKAGRPPTPIDGP
ncbi:MAG TPA: hypothetical protein VJ773_09630, partial [Gemmatimonadales bacterium]|nr:hypothetical protein [Gemmatimonadales bacterium]